MRSTKYDSEGDPRNMMRNTTLTAPLYSPFDNIQCDVVDTFKSRGGKRNSFFQKIADHIKKSYHHYSNKKHDNHRDMRGVLCSCMLPADTMDRMYTTASNHHLVAFGDSTVRNFITFYHDILRDAATMLPVSFLFPNTFVRKQIDINSIPGNHYHVYAQQTMRGASIAQFVDDMEAESVWKVKYLIANPAVCPLQNGAPLHHSSSNYSFNSSVIDYTINRSGSNKSSSSSSSSSSSNSLYIPYEQWIQESYEELSDPEIRYEDNARNVCERGGAGSLILFVLSAGLHYMPVS
jgi:hypothetical protein